MSEEKMVNPELKDEPVIPAAAEDASFDAEAIMQKYDKESAFRNLKGFPQKLVFCFCVLWSCFQLYTGLFGTFPSTLQRAPHLAAAMTLVFLLYPAGGKPGRTIPWYDYILALCCIFCGSYHIIFYDELLLRAGSFTTLDIIVSCMAIVLLLEAARRVAGLVIVSISSIFLLYAFLGQHLPKDWFLFHARFTFKRVAFSCSWSSRRS